jgi:hypothetical protein
MPGVEEASSTSQSTLERAGNRGAGGGGQHKQKRNSLPDGDNNPETYLCLGAAG